MGQARRVDVAAIAVQCLVAPAKDERSLAFWQHCAISFMALSIRYIKMSSASTLM